MIFRVDDSPTDFHLLLRPQAAEVTSARVDARQGDQYGRFDAADWFTADTRLQRRMVLLREGALVVCDRVQPGPTADGWQAGPLWHIRSEPQAGENWYNATGREELLVWLGPAPGRSCGVQTTLLWSGTKPFTVFSKETLKANRPAEFLSVLVPHGSNVAATSLAAGIHVAHGPGDSTTIELPGPKSTIRLQFGPDDAWSVSRQSNIEH